MTRRDPESDDSPLDPGDAGTEERDSEAGTPSDDPAGEQSGEPAAKPSTTLEATRPQNRTEAKDESPDLHAVVNWDAETPVNRAFRHATSSGLQVFLALVAAAVLYVEFESALRAGVTEPRFVFFVGLSAVPALALVVYIWSTDGAASTSPLVLLGMFLLGGLYVGLAGRLQVMVQPYVVAEFIDPVSFSDAVGPIFLFLIVGSPIEELLKLLVVRLYGFPSIGAVPTGAVYGAVAGLGFATMENAVFIVDSVGTTAAGRRAIAGPGHVIYSAIAGFYLGLARFNSEHAGPIALKGVTLAVVFHTVYNVLVSSETFDLTARIADLLNFSDVAALVTIAIVYDGLIFLFLLHQLSRYRNATDAASGGSVDSELTEFDP